MSAAGAMGVSSMTITEPESPPDTAFSWIVCLSWTGTKRLPLSFFTLPFFACAYACFCMCVAVRACGSPRFMSGVVLINSSITPYSLRQVSHSIKLVLLASLFGGSFSIFQGWTYRPSPVGIHWVLRMQICSSYLHKCFNSL